MQVSEVVVVVVEAVVIDSRGSEARGSEQSCRSQGRAAGRLGNWWAERWRRRFKAPATKQGGDRVGEDGGVEEVRSSRRRV